MHFVCRAVLWAWAAVLAGVPAQAAESQPWAAVVKQDALTDEVSRRVCAAQDDFRLCFEFDDRGVWASVSSLGSAVFDTQLFPAFRVDQHDAIESVNADVLRLESLELAANHGFDLGIPGLWFLRLRRSEGQNESQNGKTVTQHDGHLSRG